MGAWDVKFSDLPERYGAGKLACGCCTSFVAFVLIMLLAPASIHQLGQKKLGLTKNTFTGVVDLDTTYTPGRYWVGFWQEFIEFPSTLNTIEFSDEAPEEGVQHQNVLRSRDKDGKQIFLDLSLQYVLVPEKVGALYSEMTTLYEDVYISALRDALSKACNNFAIAKVWEDYEGVVQLMRDACVRTLNKRHALCWDIQLWRVRLEGRYENALIRTQVRKQAQRTEEARKNQAYVRAKTQVVLAEYRKNRTVIESSGTARKYEITRAAVANAKANTISVQADILKEIHDVVQVNVTGSNMNENQLVTYQKLIMLHGQSDAHFVYSGDPVQPVNVRAAQMITAAEHMNMPQEL